MTEDRNTLKVRRDLRAAQSQSLGKIVRAWNQLTQIQMDLFTNLIEWSEANLYVNSPRPLPTQIIRKTERLQASIIALDAHIHKESSSVSQTSQFSLSRSLAILERLSDTNLSIQQLASLTTEDVPLFISLAQRSVDLMRQRFQEQALAERLILAELTRNTPELHAIPMADVVALVFVLTAALWILLGALSVSRFIQEPNTGGLFHSLEQETLLKRLNLLESGNLALGRQTERLQTTLSAEEQKLRTLETDLALIQLYNENLVNSMQSGLVVTTTNLEITNYNRRAQDILSLSRDSIRQSFRDQPLCTTIQTTRRDFDHLISQAITAVRSQRFEAISYTALDRNLVLDIRMVPIKDGRGSCQALMWMLDDISEATEMKNQLYLAEHMAAVGRVSAQVAHEIRNPLSAIGLNAEMLEEEFATALPETQQSEALALLRAIAREIERLNEITEDYLQLARLPSPNLQPIALNPLISDLLTLLRPEFDNRGISLQLNMQVPNPVVLADSGQMRQALLNIIRNAQEAMADGGLLRLETSLSAEHLIITIEDNGPGVPTDVSHRIYEPFFTTKATGTGLGLSLTQQIIRDHHGSLELLNVAPQGARMCVLLPYAAQETREDNLESPN
ncbi:MAG: ATP-binding protein [Myxococcota bacterium]|nr:ATP-binding protein [Myxococcota bacterium]